MATDCLPIILSVLHKNAQKSSTNFKPSIHNVLSTGTNFGGKYGFPGAWGSQGINSHHLFPHGGLQVAKNTQ